MAEHNASGAEGGVNMLPEAVCASLREAGQALFECDRAPEKGIRVRTPLLYPDGGIIDIFVLEQDGHLEVTDFGEALGWLKMQSPEGYLSAKQERLIRDISLTLGVECLRGQLLCRVCDGDIATAVLRVAQAVIRVTDLCAIQD